MAYTLSQLGNTFHDLMYDILCGGDGQVPPSKDTFITWASPGLPYTADNFDFAVNGVGAPPAAGPGGAPLSPADQAAAVRRNWQNAYTFATQMDYIPDVAAAYSNDRQQGVFKTSDMRFSFMYERILTAAKVVDDSLTEEQTKELARLRGLLRVTKSVPDLINGGTKEVTDDSPVLKEYKKYQAAAWAAQLAYNTKRVAASTGADPVAVNDFAFNGQVYRQQYEAAVADWEANGYRGDVDGILAKIDAMTKQSMAGWRQELVNLYKNSILSTPTGVPFPYTTLFPSEFATAPGWTNYSMNHAVVDTHTHTSTTTWSAGVGLTWGGFWLGGGASGSSSSMSSDFAMDEFELSFELTQTMIARPGIYPEWFYNRGWDLEKGVAWPFDGLPSDGARPPSGLLVGYPVQAIFARNVSMRSQAFASHYEQSASQVGVDGSVGWGPFCLKGSYGHGSTDQKFHSESDGARITAPGLQLIAFVNHLLPKSPDLLPEIPKDKLI